MTGVTDGEAFLRHFHDSWPGGSPRAFARGRLADGRDSYAWLADHAAPGERVLDLCCGDGFLLAGLAGRGAVPVGVDLSAGELDAARERGVGELHLGRAQALPFPDASFDGVTCSWALMLLDELPTVLREVRRVLRPGGWFAAVLGGAPPQVEGNVWPALLAEVRRREQPGTVALGDPRAREPAALFPLVVQAGFTGVAVVPEPYDLSGGADELTGLVLGMYNPAWMRDADRDDLERAVRARLDATHQPCLLGVVLLDARRP